MLLKPLISCLIIFCLCGLVTTQRHRQQQRNRATVSTKASVANKASSSDSSTPNATTANPVDNSNQPLSTEGELVCPRPCDASSHPMSRAIEAFWSNDVIAAEACACQVLQLNRADGIAEAIRYEAAHSPFMPAAYRQSALAVPKPQAQPPYVLVEYEVLGPVPIGKLEVDADSTFAAYEHSKRSDRLSKHDRRTRVGAGSGPRARVDVLQLRRDEYLRHDDPVAFLLALPPSAGAGRLPVFSEFSADGLAGGWQRKKAAGSGQLEVQFAEVPWQGLANSMSSTSVLEFQGWARTVTFAATAGTYVVSCQGTHAVYIRNSNRTHLLAADVYSTGGVDNGLGELASGIGIAGSRSAIPVIQSRVLGSLYLKAGVVGIVMPVRGVVRASVSCHIRLADWGSATVAQSATSAGGGARAAHQQPVLSSMSAISAGGAEVSLLPHLPKCVPELLEWEFAEGLDGATASSNRPKSTGMGLLLSDVLLLPIHNLLTEAVEISVGLELSDALADFLGSVGEAGRLPPYVTKNINSSTLSIRPVTLEAMSSRGPRVRTGAEGGAPEGLLRGSQGPGLGLGRAVGDDTVKIAPGQTMAVPLQLYRVPLGADRGPAPSLSVPGVHTFEGGEAEEDGDGGGEYPPDGEDGEGAVDVDRGGGGEWDAGSEESASLNPGESSRSYGRIEDDAVFLPCGSSSRSKGASGDRTGSFLYYVVLSPSRGNQIKVPFELQCRRRSESVMLSYLDHDGSVAQAAVLFPLVSDSIAQKAGRQHSALATNFTRPDGFAPGGVPGASAPHWMDIAHREMRRRYRQAPGVDAHAQAAFNDQPCHFPYLHKRYPIYPGCFPVLFSLHGSGSPARNHADAYKRKLGRGEPNGFTHTLTSAGAEYLFGINNFFVVVPSRFGAHNWETVGGKSALHITEVFARVMARFSPFLPQVRSSGHMVAGHSMGGHGALVVATAQPAQFVCASFASGWLRKENYGGGNDFQRWDADEVGVEPQLKALLEANLAEFHPDRLVGNLQFLKYLHVRVGRNDVTTPPWYSRRLMRLLAERFGPGTIGDVEEIGGGVAAQEVRPSQPASQSRKLNSKFADRGRTVPIPQQIRTHTHTASFDPGRLELANAVLDEDAVVAKLRVLFSGNRTLGGAEGMLESQFDVDERAFIEHQLVPRVLLEELPDKEHWWWDTLTENDGGVLNDFSMRVLYNKCFAHSVKQQWVRWLVGSMHRAPGLPGAGKEEKEEKEEDGALSDIEAATDEPSRQMNLQALVFNHSEHLRILARGEGGAGTGWYVEVEASGGRSSAVSGRSKASAEAARLFAEGRAGLDHSRGSTDMTAREHMKREQLEKLHQQQELAGGGRQGGGAAESVGEERELRRVDIDPTVAVPALSASSVQAAALAAHQCYGLLAVPSHISSPASTSFEVATSSIVTHSGSCGIQIMQQKRSLASSSVQVDCFSENLDNPQERRAVQGGGEARTGAQSFDWSSYEAGADAAALAVAQARQDAATRRREGLPVPLVSCSLRTENVKRVRILFNSVHSKDKPSEIVDNQPRADLMPVGLHELTVNGALVRELSAQEQAECARTVGGARSASCLYWSRLLPQTSGGVRYMDLCVGAAADGQRAVDCTSAPSNALLEKTALAAGPIREIYARPLVVVVGTLQSKKANADQRIACKEFAVYLANSIYAAYESTVRVMTDVEYLGFVSGLVSRQFSEHGETGERMQQLFPNVICVGSPRTNKVMKMFHEQQRHGRSKFQSGGGSSGDKYHDQVLFGLQQQSDDMSSAPARGAGGRPSLHRDLTRHTLLGNLPVQFEDSSEWTGRRQRDQGTMGGVADTPDGDGFRLPGSPIFAKKHHALLFAFPLQLVVRPSASANALFTVSALAVCIHSNDNEFVSLSRWMWPTVPPMVRAPLEINSLDYVVLDTHRLHSRGYGAILATGIWDQRWDTEGERGRESDDEASSRGEGAGFSKQQL